MIFLYYFVVLSVFCKPTWLTTSVFVLVRCTCLLETLNINTHNGISFSQPHHPVRVYHCWKFFRMTISMSLTDNLLFSIALLFPFSFLQLHQHSSKHPSARPMVMYCCLLAYGSANSSVWSGFDVLWCNAQDASSIQSLICSNASMQPVQCMHNTCKNNRQATQQTKAILLCFKPSLVCCVVFPAAFSIAKSWQTFSILNCTNIWR